MIMNPLVSLCQDPEYVVLPLEQSNMSVTFSVTMNGKTSECQQRFIEQEAYSIILTQNVNGIQCKLVSGNGFF